MPSQTLAHMIATRVRTIQWHVQNGSKGPHSGYQRNVEEIERLVKAYMPSGSGFDIGTACAIADSKPARLIFNTSYHHMHTSGMYDGWTEHRVIVIAEHDGMDIVVGGRDRNGIKDYIAEQFQQALSQTINAVWIKEEEDFEFFNEHGWKA